MYFVIKYENKSILQPLNIIFKSDNLNIAKKKAYVLACDMYGSSYIEDFKNINDSKITQNFWNVKSLYDYSDWSIGIDGTFDNIVFSVIEIDFFNISLESR
jgi:hypothetical protein